MNKNVVLSLLVISVLALIVLWMSKGSESHPSVMQKTEEHGQETHPKGHEHPAPHGGTLVVFGEEFAHMELVLDKTTGTLAAYVLDGSATVGVPVEEASLTLSIQLGETTSKLVLQALANPLSGESIGHTSQFVGSSEKLRGVENFKGILASLRIRGMEFKNVPFQFPQGNEDH